MPDDERDATRHSPTDPAPPLDVAEQEPDTGPNHDIPDFTGHEPPALPPGVAPKDWRQAILGRLIRMGLLLKEAEASVKVLREEFDSLNSEVDGMPAGGQ